MGKEKKATSKEQLKEKQILRKNNFRESVKKVMERLIKQKKATLAESMSMIFPPPAIKIEEDSDQNVKLEDDEGLPALDLIDKLNRETSERSKKIHEVLGKVSEEVGSWIDKFEDHIQEGVTKLKLHLKSQEVGSSELSKKIATVLRPSRIRRKVRRQIKKLHVKRKSCAEVFKFEQREQVTGGYIGYDYLISLKKMRIGTLDGRMMENLACLIGEKEISKFKVREFLVKGTKGMVRVYCIPFFREEDGDFFYPRVEGIQHLPDEMMDEVVKIFGESVNYGVMNWDDVHDLARRMAEETREFVTKKIIESTDSILAEPETHQATGLWDDILIQNLMEEHDVVPWHAISIANFEKRDMQIYGEELREIKIVKSWLSVLRYSTRQGMEEAIKIVRNKKREDALSDVVDYLSEGKHTDHLLFKSMFEFHWSIMSKRSDKLTYLERIDRFRPNRYEIGMTMAESWCIL